MYVIHDVVHPRPGKVLQVAVVALTLAPGVVLAQSGSRRARAVSAVVDTQRVVFVCEHGTVKSVVAAAHFNRLARARGLAAVAISRGSAPDSAVPAVVRNGLLADGVGPWRARPAPLSKADLLGAALVVSFDQSIDSLVGTHAPVRHWDNTPSVMQDYATGRDSIVARVRALITELQRAHPPGRRPTHLDG
jgi:protein-tyrosine-phosphatase